MHGLKLLKQKYRCCLFEGEVTILNLMNSDNYLQSLKDPWMTYEKLSEKGKNYKPNQSWR